LDDDSTCAPASANHRTDGGALPATRDGANDGAEGCTDRAPLDGILGLAVVLDRAFVIHSDRLSIGRVVRRLGEVDHELVDVVLFT
jgi:hypothetical protein